MATEKKTIAITGSTGLIGAQLFPIFLEKAIDCAPSVAVPNRIRLASVKFRGIFDRRIARDLMQGCNAVIHLAGVAHTSLRSQSEMDEAEGINIDGARNVLAAAQDAGMERVLLASSAHVYAGQEGMELDEHSPTAGDSFYARTKLMVEQAGLEVASENRIAVVIVRPCLTYGPGVRFNLESLMRAIQGHYYFGVRGICPMRSFLSVGNAAAAIAHLLKAGENVPFIILQMSPPATGRICEFTG